MDIQIKQDTGSLDDNLITNIKKVYLEGISSPNQVENNIKNVILCEKKRRSE